MATAASGRRAISWLPPNVIVIVWAIGLQSGLRKGQEARHRPQMTEGLLLTIKPAIGHALPKEAR
jgi:hypothetical protein